MNSLDIEPTAKVTMTGNFPEDESLIANFETITEDQKLYSEDKLRDAYTKGLNKGLKGKEVEDQ